MERPELYRLVRHPAHRLPMHQLLRMGRYHAVWVLQPLRVRRRPCRKLLLCMQLRTGEVLAGEVLLIKIGSNLFLAQPSILGTN